MSERHDIALRLAQIVIDGNMCRPFGGDVDKSRDGRNYGFLFSRPATLDGHCAVYGPAFILIQMQGRGAPNGGMQAVYGTEADAAAVLRAVVACDTNAVNAVPVRRTR